MKKIIIFAFAVQFFSSVLAMPVVNAQVIGTGGDIGLMNKYCRVFDTVEPDLILKGLSLIHKRGEHV